MQIATSSCYMPSFAIFSFLDDDGGNMNGKILSRIAVESYELGINDLVIGALLKSYLETMTIEQAQKELEIIFPSTTKDGQFRVSVPALALFLDRARTELPINMNTVSKEGDENTMAVKTMGIVKDFLKSLDAKEYVKTIPYGIVDMLHDCYKAIASASEN